MDCGRNSQGQQVRLGGPEVQGLTFFGAILVLTRINSASLPEKSLEFTFITPSRVHFSRLVWHLAMADLWRHTSSHGVCWWRYPNSWMVYHGNSHEHLDDLGNLQVSIILLGNDISVHAWAPFYIFFFVFLNVFDGSNGCPMALIFCQELLSKELRKLIDAGDQSMRLGAMGWMWSFGRRRWG